uniref:(northern house mosquito) hypothetical protein n=1 Tax=Culex pipiens TaxID=7175 RepID=A0A8D8C3X7_CULPI
MQLTTLLLSKPIHSAGRDGLLSARIRTGYLKNAHPKSKSYHDLEIPAASAIRIMSQNSSNLNTQSQFHGRPSSLLAAAAPGRGTITNTCHARERACPAPDLGVDHAITVPRVAAASGWPIPVTTLAGLARPSLSR